MRPTRSIKYCYDCGFRKIHFESEEKALNFIRFNAEDIRKEKGYAPLRTYYCIACGCWHLTSKPVFPYKSRTQKVLEAYKPKTKLNYTARDIGLTLINNEELNKIVASNLLSSEKQKINRVRREKINKLQKILHILNQEKQKPIAEQNWLERQEKKLLSYDDNISKWVNIKNLPNMCNQIKRLILKKKLLPSNKAKAMSLITLADLIIEKRNVIIELADLITFNLQDACSYLQSDMIASAKAKVKDAENALSRLKDYQINGFTDAMEMWDRLITSYKTTIKDRCMLDF